MNTENYYAIHTEEDVFRERFLLRASLVGAYDVPSIPAIKIYDFENLKPVSFKNAKKEVDTKHSICHSFQDDEIIQSLWNFPERYLPILQNFKYVAFGDYSIYRTMPKALQIYNHYRNMACAWYLHDFGCKVIPVLEVAGPTTWDFCFDGMPKDSTIAFTTNGTGSPELKKQAQENLDECISRLEPYNFLIIGRDIGLDFHGIEHCYMESDGQKIRKYLKENYGRKDQ